MKLHQILRPATVAWCPNASYLAAGTLVGTMGDSFDSAGSLEIFDVGLNANSEHVIDVPKVAIHTTDKLHKLVWSSDAALQSDKNPLGFIVGGSDCGLHIWNPHLLFENPNDPNAQIPIPSGHDTPVRGLDFNPNQPSLLCAGGAKGEVLIWNLTNMVAYAPGPTKGPAGETEITSVHWNRQVKHILASSAENGIVVVWDLRAKKPAASFKDPKGSRCSSVLWNPDSKVNLITTCDDDSNPVIHCWDLKNYLAPSHTLTGHTAGVMSASFCPQDHKMLLSSGRDGKTLLWDLEKNQLRSEVDNSNGTWKFDVQWSPSLACVASTCSQNEIEIRSLVDFPSGPTKADNVPPSWLRRPASISFGFGGQLINVPFQTGSTPSKIEIHHIDLDSEFIKKADALKTVIQEKSYLEFCIEKSKLNSSEKPIWDLMQVLFNNPRDSLLSYLGFDPEAVPADVKAFVENLAKEKKQDSEPDVLEIPAVPEQPTETKTQDGGDGVDGLFDGDDDGFDLSAVASASLPEGKEVAPTVATPQKSVIASIPINFESTDPVDKLLTSCLLVGNWQAAVDCCFAAGRPADALILGYIGGTGTDLLIQTQRRYLAQQKSSFMGLLAVLSTKDFTALIQRVDLTHWRQILAILCTFVYDEFPHYCEVVGDRLFHAGEDVPAMFAYICAGNLEKTVRIWLKSDISSNDSLQTFVEKVVVFCRAIDQKPITPEISTHIANYADRLAAQGRLELALSYLDDHKDVQGSQAQLLYQRIREALEPTASSTIPKPAAVAPAPVKTALPSGFDRRGSGPGSLDSGAVFGGGRPPIVVDNRPPPVPVETKPSPTFHQVTTPVVGPGPVGGGYQPPKPGPRVFGTTPAGPTPAGPPVHHGTTQPIAPGPRPGPMPIPPPSVSPVRLPGPVLVRPPPGGPAVSPVVAPSVVRPPIYSGPPPVSSPIRPTVGTYTSPAIPHTAEPLAPAPKKPERVVAPPPMGAAVARKPHEEVHEVPVEVVVDRLVGIVNALQQAGFPIEHDRVGELQARIQSGQLPAATLAMLDDFLQGLQTGDYQKIDSTFNKLNADHYNKVGTKAMIGLKHLKQHYAK